MLKHPDIWRAIDELAEAKGFSASGLAREAGLDATTFNKSKRVGADGKKRWPSTESVAKILEVTDTGFLDFAALVHKVTLKTRILALPFSALSAPKAAGTTAKQAHFDDNGQPSGKAWARRTIIGTDDMSAFAIDVNTNGLVPAFRNGSLLIAAPGAKIQKGDRVVVVNEQGAVQIGDIAKVAGKSYDVTTIGGRKTVRFTIERTAARVIAKITQIVE